MLWRLTFQFPNEKNNPEFPLFCKHSCERPGVNSTLTLSSINHTKSKCFDDSHSNFQMEKQQNCPYFANIPVSDLERGPRKPKCVHQSLKAGNNEVISYRVPRDFPWQNSRTFPGPNMFFQGPWCVINENIFVVRLHKIENRDDC